MYKKLRIIDVCNLVSLDICIILYYHYHDQDNKHIHRLQKFSCALFFFFLMSVMCTKNIYCETYLLNTCFSAQYYCLLWVLHRMVDL